MHYCVCQTTFVAVVIFMKSSTIQMALWYQYKVQDIVFMKTEGTVLFVLISNPMQ